MRLRIAILILLTSVGPLWADQAIQNVQQALKDQGFYYGEITGTKDADTTAAIRRYQIRNGLQITGDLNEETLKSLGVDSSGARAIAKASPSPVPTAPDSSDLGAEPRESAGPTNPLTGQTFPEPPAPIWNFRCVPIRRGSGFPLPVDSTWKRWPRLNCYPVPTRRFTCRAVVRGDKRRCAANGFPTADCSPRRIRPAADRSREKIAIVWLKFYPDRNAPFAVRQTRCRQKSALRCEVECD